MQKNDDIIEIAGELRHQTDKAYQFYDGKTTVWIAKSLGELDPHTKTMQMPEWVALEKGLI